MELKSNVMNKFKLVNWLMLCMIFFASCDGQNQSQPAKNNNLQIGSNFTGLPIPAPALTKVDTLRRSNAPMAITRTIKQDSKGNIWFATFGGVYKYDGKSFTNILEEVQSRFFSIMEDSKKNIWFGSIGSGVYRYDGTSFRNFSTKDGLINDEIVSMYEDSKGNIWFGANGGLSVFNGKDFKNYVIDEDQIKKGKIGFFVPSLQRPVNEVNSIIEDQTGKIWIATRGSTFVYDGITFTSITNKEVSFRNVRWIIEDKTGNIWLGGNNGLWFYNGMEFKGITNNFVGYIYEDKKGNIWTSSMSSDRWALTRYELKANGGGIKSMEEIKNGEGMFFGMEEDAEGNLWIGTLEGIGLYDGDTFHYFRR